MVYLGARPVYVLVIQMFLHVSLLNNPETLRFCFI